MLGKWIAARGNRDVRSCSRRRSDGRPGALRGLSAANDRARGRTTRSSACRPTASISTTRTSTIQATPLDETLRAFDALIKAGKVRHIGASNYSAERLAEALELQRATGSRRSRVLQPHYNLVERDFERTLLPVAEA